jgi:hypothetical protein
MKMVKTMCRYVTYKKLEFSLSNITLLLIFKLLCIVVGITNTSAFFFLGDVRVRVPLNIL